MSKKTRLITTALPHFKPDTGKLRVSVTLHPQLTRRGSRVRLGSDYYEVHNWPRYRTFFERLIHFRQFEA